MAGAKKRSAGPFSFLIIMLLVMVAYSVAEIRNAIGGGVDVVLGPLTSGPGISWMVVILVLAAITGCYSSLLQKYTIDYAKMHRTQQKMKEFQKEFREAQLSQDEKKVKKLEGKKERMMQDQLEMSQEQFKPMGYIMIITVPLFLWMLLKVPTMGSITLPFWGSMDFGSPTPFFLPAWILWYMICSITMSQVIRKALDIGGI